LITQTLILKRLAQAGGVLISPIQVTPAPIPVKTLQSQYYAQRSFYLVRRGPATSDDVRATSSIDYVRPGFSFPVALVAPPIIMQQRADKTSKCKNSFGSFFQTNLWQHTIEGETCREPYSCGDLVDSSTNFMACSADSPPPSFFGQKALLDEGKPKFFEFLSTVTDAPVIRRGQETIETNLYLDFQTRVIEVVMIAFAPEYGIASTIKISAALGSKVSVDYSHLFNILHLMRISSYGRTQL